MTTLVSHLLNTTVEVRRRAVSPDGIGGQIVDWASLGPIRARVSSPPSGTVVALVSAAQSSERAPYHVFVEPDADVRRGDLLVEGSRTLWVDAVTWPSIGIYHRADARDYQAEEPIGDGAA